MKLKFIFLLLLLSSNFIFSQEKVISSNDKEVLTVSPTEKSENGKVENNVYTCYKFDWKIKIPLNYEITKSVSQDLTHLIGFGIGLRDNFTSSFESLKGSQIKSLEEHKKFMIQLLNNTYSNIETLKFELNSATMRIGNYDFYKIQTKLYDSKTNELLLTQDLYNSFIGTNLFSVNINYNNPNVGKLLTENFISSLSN